MKKEKKIDKASRWLTIVLLIIFLPIIFINITLIITSYIVPKHLPGIFGIKPVIVLSGSMSPVFEPKSLIFVKGAETEELEKGDIICYLSGDVAITHRIEQVIGEGKDISYITKGDANNTTDRLAVSPEQVEGVYFAKISRVGGFAMFMQSTTGMIVFIAIPIFLYLVFDILKKKSEQKREKEHTKQLEAELRALKAEQQNN